LFSSLSRDSKDYFKDFGSEAVTKLGFRDAWAMIGQRGLASGKAIEQVLFSSLFEGSGKRLYVEILLQCDTGKHTRVVLISTFLYLLTCLHVEW